MLRAARVLRPQASHRACFRTSALQPKEVRVAREELRERARL